MVTRQRLSGTHANLQAYSLLRDHVLWAQKPGPALLASIRSSAISSALRHASKSERPNGGENLCPMLSVNCRGTAIGAFLPDPAAIQYNMAVFLDHTSEAFD